MNYYHHQDTILWRPAGLTKKTTNCSRSFKTATATPLPSWSSATPGVFTASRTIISQNKAAAEDVVQDAFLKLWENPALWQAERNSKFTTWFYRIVVNLCLDQHLKKKPEVLDNDALVADDRAQADELVIRDQEQKMVEKEIAALPERQRTALNLCFDAGLTNQEAAEVMGLKLKALQSLIMRAKDDAQRAHENLFMRSL